MTIWHEPKRSQLKGVNPFSQVEVAALAVGAWALLMVALAACGVTPH